MSAFPLTLFVVRRVVEWTGWAMSDEAMEVYTFADDGTETVWSTPGRTLTLTPGTGG